MELDAAEALEVGRHAEAVILGWSALESAVRATVPGTAYRNGLRITELDELLGVRGANRTPSLSFEESVERGATRAIVRAAATLPPQIAYDAASFSESVEGVLRLRNRIVHQGVRPTQSQAAAALDASNFYLRQVPLRDVPSPPADHSWTETYGDVPPTLAQCVEERGLRLVLANPTGRGFIKAWWDPERIGNDLWLRVDPSMPVEVIDVLAVISVEAWALMQMNERPRLRVSERATEFLMAGLLHAQAEEVEFSIARAEALHHEWDTAFAVDATCRFFVDRPTSEMQPDAVQLRPDDARSVTMAIDLGCFLSGLPDGEMVEELSRLSDPNEALRLRAVAWASDLHRVDGAVPHSVCDALRAIHDSTPLPWLDSILVDCPIESTTYGA